jgi:hypothetical protein
LLIACSSPTQRLEDVSKGLPLPKDTVALTFVIEESQGSQDACFFTRRANLYASKLPIDEVVSFYTSKLNESAWEQTDKQRLLFRRGSDYKLSLNYAATTDKSIVHQKYQDVDPNNAVLETHPTLYEITLTYADPFAQMGCPIWNR